MRNELWDDYCPLHLSTIQQRPRKERKNVRIRDLSLLQNPVQDNSGTRSGWLRLPHRCWGLKHSHSWLTGFAWCWTFDVKVATVLSSTPWLAWTQFQKNHHRMTPLVFCLNMYINKCLYVVCFCSVKDFTNRHFVMQPCCKMMDKPPEPWNVTLISCRNWLLCKSS